MYIRLFNIENVIHSMSLPLFGIVESCHCEWMTSWITQ